MLPQMWPLSARTVLWAPRDEITLQQGPPAQGARLLRVELQMSHDPARPHVSSSSHDWNR